MSKLIDIYDKLKKEDSKTVYLFKIGIFYIALNKDAEFLSIKYNLKLTNLNSSTLKCGFPCSSFDKYYIKFTNDSVKFKIIENNTLFESSDYLKNAKIIELIEKINKVDIDSLSIPEAYKFIEDLKELSLSLKWMNVI